MCSLDSTLDQSFPDQFLQTSLLRSYSGVGTASKTGFGSSSSVKTDGKPGIERARAH